MSILTLGASTALSLVSRYSASGYCFLFTGSVEKRPKQYKNMNGSKISFEANRICGCYSFEILFPRGDIEATHWNWQLTWGPVGMWYPMDRRATAAHCAASWYPRSIFKFAAHITWSMLLLVKMLGSGGDSEVNFRTSPLVMSSARTS